MQKSLTRTKLEGGNSFFNRVVFPGLSVRKKSHSYAVVVTASEQYGLVKHEDVHKCFIVFGIVFNYCFPFSVAKRTTLSRSQSWAKYVAPSVKKTETGTEQRSLIQTTRKT